MSCSGAITTPCRLHYFCCGLPAFCLVALKVKMDSWILCPSLGLHITSPEVPDMLSRSCLGEILVAGIPLKVPHLLRGCRVCTPNQEGFLPAGFGWTLLLHTVEWPLQLLPDGFDFLFSSPPHPHQPRPQTPCLLRFSRL